jgi:hypothetical protein
MLSLTPVVRVRRHSGPAAFPSPKITWSVSHWRDYISRVRPPSRKGPEYTRSLDRRILPLAWLAARVSRLPDRH